MWGPTIVGFGRYHRLHLNKLDDVDEPVLAEPIRNGSHHVTTVLHQGWTRKAQGACTGVRPTAAGPRLVSLNAEGLRDRLPGEPNTEAFQQFRTAEPTGCSR
jgi:hypothetical protein